jgi:hypothetical protein
MFHFFININPIIKNIHQGKLCEILLSASTGVQNPSFFILPSHLSPYSSNPECLKTTQKKLGLNISNNMHSMGAFNIKSLGSEHPLELPLGLRSSHF